MSDDETKGSKAWATTKIVGALFLAASALNNYFENEKMKTQLVIEQIADDDFSRDLSAAFSRHVVSSSVAQARADLRIELMNERQKDDIKKLWRFVGPVAARRRMRVPTPSSGQPTIEIAQEKIVIVPVPKMPKRKRPKHDDPRVQSRKAGW